MRQVSATDPYLVIEQKGLRVLVTGVMLALIMAMTFRAIFSPQRVKYEIERVIEESNPQKIELKVEKAYLSLAQGWFPRLAVVIENLELQSQDPCLYYAKIHAGMMILPVSLQSIFDRSLVLKRLEVDNLVAHLKTKDVKCDTSMITPTPGEVAVGGESKPIVQSQNTTTSAVQQTNNINAPPAPLVQTLSIEGSPLREILLIHGELHFDTFPDFYLQFKKLKAELASQPEKSALIDGNLELVPATPEDRLIGWNARFQMEINEKLIKSHVKGQWREGSVNLDLNFKNKENELNLSGDFKQIPLGQIFIFTNEMGWTKAAPSARQSWISFHAEYNQQSKKNKQVNVKDIKVEGDFGDIKVPLLEGQGEPFVWQPIKVELNSVHISKLLTAFDQPHPSNSLASLGVFSGMIDLEGPHFRGAVGELKGLEFVFSNKGIRDMQVVSTMHLDVSEADNQYKGKITDLELKDGDFKGQIEATYLRAEASTQVHVQLDQIKLNPKVEKLMTNRGFLSPLQGKLSFLLKKGEKPHIQGLLKADSGQIEMINFEKFKWEINSNNDDELWKLSFQELKWSADTPSLETLQEIFRVEGSVLEMKNFSVKGKRGENSFEWSDLQAQLQEPKIRINSQGAWDEDGKIKGNIQIKSDKEVRQLSLSGTRESPEWK
jgi:hypothetical protein